MNRQTAITFFYYDDIHTVTDFYESTLGFELVLDQGMARIYRTAPNCYLGIVDGNRGHLKHQPSNAVLLTMVSDDVEGWHEHLSEAGVDGLSAILKGTYCVHFFFRDPAGYAIEVQRFHDPAVAALFK